MSFLRTASLLAVVLVSSFFGSWLSPSLADESGSFHVGVIIPLTGDLADYGSSIQRGIQIARSETPAAFSHIQFAYEDSKYEGKTAVTALEKLRASNATDLFYLWGVSPTEAILPITEARKLPVIVETTLKESTTRKKYVIRAARTGERIAKALAAELKKRGFSSVSFLNAEIPFYNDILQHLEALLPEQGISITKIHRLLPSENDLRHYIPKLHQQKNDALGLFLLPAQFISFYKEALQAKLSVPTFSADIIGSDSIIQACPNNINGTFFTEVGVTPEFRKLYEAKFGKDGHIGHAAQAYDVAIILRDLFGKLDRRPSNDEIMKAIAEMSPRQGATGDISYTDTPGDGKQIRVPVAMKHVRNKQIETITEDTGF